MPATNKITTDLTPVPSRAAPSTFSPYMDALLAKLPTWATQANALADEADANADAAAAAATTATTKASEAGGYATDAQTAADAAAASSNATRWSGGTTYAGGDVVWSPVDYQTYRRIVAGAGTTDPSADPTNWTRAVFVPSSIYRSTRTSNTMLGADDSQKLIDITSGTFTQTFDAAATMGDGWYCYIRNSGAGDITLDPDDTELIDGLASYVMYPGEVRLIQCDGLALRSVVLQSFYKIFTATGTFIKPPGYSVFAGLAWSGGQSGAKAATNTLSRGGAGGGCFDFHILAADMAATETVTIGSGGAARTTYGSGNAGGSTSIGSFFTISGGLGSGGSVAGTVGPTSGVSAAGYQGGNDINTNLVNCSSDWGGASSSDGGAHNSGNSVWGGAAGGSISDTNVAQNGGTSINGGDGGNASVASDGADGTVPGGGGGATQTGTQSGAGARGEVRIWGII